MGVGQTADVPSGRTAGGHRTTEPQDGGVGEHGLDAVHDERPTRFADRVVHRSQRAPLRAMAVVRDDPFAVDRLAVPQVQPLLESGDRQDVTVLADLVHIDRDTLGSKARVALGHVHPDRLGGRGGG